MNATLSPIAARAKRKVAAKDSEKPPMLTAPAALALTTEYAAVCQSIKDLEATKDRLKADLIGIVEPLRAAHCQSAFAGTVKVNSTLQYVTYHNGQKRYDEAALEVMRAVFADKFSEYTQDVYELKAADCTKLTEEQMDQLAAMGVEIMVSTGTTKQLYIAATLDASIMACCKAAGVEPMIVALKGI